ncbi:hypothetical protein [uncultured Azohydromonas sp.]|jgi:hypothetical protein|uniref:hypothetical protein n=1 Tax=uncultured Azohydromonas sp. TaxID=487342 RepID=UPI0026152921|nr:hypothetical protein [uncultured Azohydromonas sp.]
MPEIDATYDAWHRTVPSCFEGLVVWPRAFRQHEDEEALAIKLVGVDSEGRRCWIRHDHTAVAEGFDIDEQPIDVLLGHERRTAWRLRSGYWLLQVDRIERLESCAPRVVNQPVLVVREEELGL